MNDMIKEVKTGLTDNQKMKLTTSNIAEKLLSIMKNHIGEVNAISKKRLFYRIFRKSFDDSLKSWIRWEFTKKAMHLCRTRTRCFIVSKNVGAELFYFVPTSREENHHYINRLNKSIRAMNNMKSRSRMAVDEMWYEDSDEWKLPDNTRLIR